MIRSTGWTAALVISCMLWQPVYSQSRVGATGARTLSDGGLSAAHRAVPPQLVGATTAGGALSLSAIGRSRTLEIRKREQQAIIDRLITQRGTYGAGLDEAYGDYADLQVESGNYVEAARLYRQAWHLSRVNSGLYSEAQLAPLQAMIETLVELKQWDEVHNFHQLSFLIASRVYPADDIRYAMAAELYTGWQWQALNGKYVAGGYVGLLETAQQLSAVYEQVIDKMERANGAHSDRFVRLVLGKARVDMSIARGLSRSQLARNTLGFGGAIPDTRCVDGPVGQPGAPRRCRGARIAASGLIDAGSGSGNFALGRYLEKVDQSISRLDRIRSSTDGLSAAQLQWIDNQLHTLHAEAEALL